MTTTSNNSQPQNHNKQEQQQPAPQPTRTNNQPHNRQEPTRTHPKPPATTKNCFESQGSGIPTSPAPAQTSPRPSPQPPPAAAPPPGASASPKSRSKSHGETTHFQRRKARAIFKSRIEQGNQILKIIFCSNRENLGDIPITPGNSSEKHTANTFVESRVVWDQLRAISAIAGFVPCLTVGRCYHDFTGLLQCTLDLVNLEAR